MKRSHHNIRSGQRGFTLTELLVAISITIVMVGLMLTVVTNTLNVWNRTTGDLSAENQARQIMELVAQDLQAAVLRADNNVWIAATVQVAGINGNATNESWTIGAPKPADTSLDLAPALGEVDDRFEDTRFGQAGIWLRLFTNSRETGATTEINGPRAVSYQIARRRPSADTANPFVYQLFRSRVSHQATFDTGYDLFDPVYNETSANSATAPAAIRKPNANYLLANNVIDFGVRFLRPDSAGTGWEVLFPQQATDLGFAASADTTKFPTGGSHNTSNFRHGFPTAADIYVRILTSEGVRLITALENGDIDGDWWQIAEQHSQVFTRRVSIPSRPN